MEIDLPSGWEEAARRIAEEKPHRVLVIGEVDVGKSTFISFLLRQLLGGGLRCSLVDADIGQKDLGPPATVTLGEYQYLYELRLAKLKAMYFVGSTSPRRHLLPLLVGTKLLAERAKGEVVVINTTGFVKNAGFALKGFKIELVEPDLIVALQRGGELEALLRSYAHVPCLRLPVSSKAKPKSFEERRALRREAFRRYFSTAREVELEVNSLRFQRVASLDEETGALTLRRNLLVGLADESGGTMGLGIIKDFAEDVLRVVTPVKARVAVVQVGSMLLRENGEEMGFVRW